MTQNPGLTMTDEENPEREKSRAIRTRQRAIGRELRRMFDEVVQEPVPKDLLDLLYKIDASGEVPGKKAS